MTYYRDVDLDHVVKVVPPRCLHGQVTLFLLPHFGGESISSDHSPVGERRLSSIFWKKWYLLEFFCKDDLSLLPYSLIHSFNFLLILISIVVLAVMAVGTPQIGSRVPLIGPHIFFKLSYFLALREAPGSPPMPCPRVCHLSKDPWFLSSENGSQDWVPYCIFSFYFGEVIDAGNLATSTKKNKNKKTRQVLSGNPESHG